MRFYVRFTALAAMAVTAAALDAATCRYTGGGNTASWSVPGNWENGAVPGAGDDVVVLARADGSAIEIDSELLLSSLTTEGGSEVTFAGAGAIVLGGDLTANVQTTFGSGIALSFSKNTSCIKAGQNPANAQAGVTFDGPVLLQDTVTGFYLSGKGAIVFNNTLTGTTATIGPATGKEWSDNSPVTFNGTVKVKAVIFRSHQSRSEFIFTAAGNEWEVMEAAYGCISFKARNAAPERSVLSWNTWAWEAVDPNYCSYCFNGFDQTIDRIATVAAGDRDGHFVNPNTYWAENSKPAVLTLRGRESAQTDAKLIGRLSLVWAPEGGYVQDFIRRAHTMSGFLAVSNGTLRVSGGASFASVGRIEVGGGVFEADTAAENAFAGVTNVFVAAGAVLRLGEAADDPFPSSAVLELESGAVISVPEGKVCSFKAVKVDGVPVAAWSYTGSGGSVGSECAWIEGGGSVEVLEGDGGNAVWTGGGSDDKTSTPGNWLDSKPISLGDGLTVTAGGGVMALAGDIHASSVEFSASSPRTFRVAADDSAPAAELGIASGGLVFSGSAAQTNELYVPVSLLSSVQTWSLGGGKNLLRIGGAVSGRFASTDITVQADGASCEITGTMDYDGTFTFNDGNLDVCGSSFGPAVTVRMEGNEKPSAMTFRGGEFLSPVSLEKKAGSGWTATDAMFPSGVTNIFTGAFRIKDSWHDLRLLMGSAAKTVFRGGLSQPSGQAVNFMFNGNNSSVEIGEMPVFGVCGKGIVLMSWSRSNEIIFSTTNNSVSGPLTLQGITLRTACDWAFSTNTVMMPLAMKALSGAVGSVFDLQGFDQAVGRLVGGDDQDTQGVITSAEPACLHVYQTGAAAETVFAPVFAGAVSLCKHGADALALSGASVSTGIVQVAQGTLSFSGNGSWRTAGGITLTGGELRVDDAERLPAETAYRLFGGRLHLGGGVRLKTRSAYVKNENGNAVELEPGIYTAENLPSCISGEGQILVKGDGLTVIVR